MPGVRNCINTNTLKEGVKPQISFCKFCRPAKGGLLLMSDDNFYVKYNELVTDNCPYEGCDYNKEGDCNNININNKIDEGEIISDFICTQFKVPVDVCEFCGKKLVEDHEGKLICPNGCLEGMV